MGMTFGSRRRSNVMGQFARLADIDPTSAATVLSAIAEEAGTTVVEAAVVSIRTMQVADAMSPQDAVVVLSDVSRDFIGGGLRFPVSNRPLHTSCHPAQAVRLILLILETLRPDHYANVEPAPSQTTAPGGRPYLTLVPPLNY